jgi:hypothetical protein
MPIDMDLGGVASAGTPLPEGDYIFDILDATCKKAGQGKSGHNFRLRLEVAEESGDEIGRTHLENLNIQESTKPFVKAFITKWLGQSDDEVTRMTFDINDPEDVENYDESIPDYTVRSINGVELIGTKVGGTVKHKDDDGKVYGNIVAWHTAG